MIVDARRRARIAMRREVADAAFDLLAEKGYDGTTVDEIAKDIGISRTSFFRYFETKEDVVIETAAPPEIDFASAVNNLGDAERIRPFAEVCRVLVDTLPTVEQQTPRLRARVLMTTTNPALGARLTVRRRARQSELSAALITRGVEPEVARLSSALGFACLDVAWREWVIDSERRELRHHYEHALAQASQLFSERA